MHVSSILRVALGGLLACVVLNSGAARADEEERPVAFEKDVAPILTNYCYNCHGYGGEEGGLALDRLAAEDDPAEHRQRWLAVLENLRSQIMPPPSESQPTAEERAKLISWITREAFQLDPDNPDPGRVTIRRLNRQEYENTIRDLLGVDFDAADEFPADDTGYGFDTIGDVLSMSPLLTEKYFEAAREVVDEAIPEDRSSDQYKRIFVDGPPSDSQEERAEYARKILRRFADRAFRRPVDEPTLDSLVDMATKIAQGENRSFEDGVGVAMTAALTSPRFLFRAEIQPEPDNPGQVVPVDEFALASRLSYFLWSSMPDEELFRLAREGKLRDRLREQVDRMLADERAEELVENFVGQWLQTRDVEGISVDARRVLGIRDWGKANRIFNDRVRRAMRQETELLFKHLIDENKSSLELLTADYTFLNEPLAEFYGVEGVDGREMRKVDLPKDSPRGGLLTHGSVLLVTSNPTRTSPVKRGLFVLENLLGTPPPPAPPNVPELEEVRKGEKNLTMREMMEVHREDPLCASCHARMDPLGLALENFNALGMYREKEEGKTIDTSGKLISGEEFDDVNELARVLATDRRSDYYRALAEKLFTYALGRGVEYYDAPAIDKIVNRLESDGGKMRTLIYGVVESAAFQKRRGDGEPAS